jgi:hypothetical protein
MFQAIGAPISGGCATAGFIQHPRIRNEVAVMIECKEYRGSTKSDLLVTNFVSRLEAWGITGTQKQYVV